jgi:excisionase family DNA binding protein
MASISVGRGLAQTAAPIRKLRLMNRRNNVRAKARKTLKKSSLPEPRADLKLYSEAEAAEMLSVSCRTLYRLRTTGELPSVKIGTRVRYRHTDLARLIARNSASAHEV